MGPGVSADERVNSICPASAREEKGGKNKEISSISRRGGAELKEGGSAE